MSSSDPARSAPSGQPSPFDRQSVTVSKRAAIAGWLDVERTRGVQEPRAVEVNGEPELAGCRHDVVELGERPHAST